MFKLAVDLGYGYVKGINEFGEKILFPSVVGPARDLRMKSLLEGMDEAKYMVTVEVGGGASGEFFIGDLAVEECPTASFAFDENKVDHPHTGVLLAAAASLLAGRAGEDAGLQLATGLPLQHFFAQRDQFLEYLNSFKAEIAFHNCRTPFAGKVAFEKVTLFPQGAGAILEAGLQDGDLLQMGSYIGLVDFGFKTTDYVVYEVSEKFKPKASMSGTINVGMADFRKAVETAFADMTGCARSALGAFDIENIIRYGRTYYSGREYDLGDVIESARASVAGAVLDRLKEAWGHRANFLRVLYLAGGGAEEFAPYFKRFHGDIRMLNDPQFGNARGFLRVIRPRKETVRDNVVRIRKAEGV